MDSGEDNLNKPIHLDTDIPDPDEELFNLLNDIYLDELQPITYDVEDIDIKQNNSDNFNYRKKTSKFNQGIIENGLLPELRENEKQKRELKPKLLNAVITLIRAYSGLFIIVLFAFVASIIIYPWFEIKLEIELMNKFISFLEFFIGATFAEFIGMLFFIVHYIFDKSIVELMKEFKKENDENKEQDNNTNENKSNSQDKNNEENNRSEDNKNAGQLQPFDK